MDNTHTTRRAGLFESAIQKLFTRSAQVLAVDQIGGGFRLVTLGGEALRDAGWTPGDKIQIQLGGWVQRTYTPIDWDAASGRARILVYLHGDAPGTQWARGLRAGDRCSVFGPRKSVRLEALSAGVILFGDETSLGLAAALASQAPLHLLLETSTDAGAALSQLGLRDAQCCVRNASDAHLIELEGRLSALLQAHPAADIVLSGRASAIQHMSRLLRQHGVAATRRQSKAYWAAGKTGLD
jgi:NADPH-dependent ferric siderophore reductase